MTYRALPANRRGWRRWLALAALVAVLGLVLLAGYRLFTEVSFLRSAPRDNVQWTLAQLEVDLLKFRDAVRGAQMGDAGVDNVRRKFDLFYSRVGTLSEGRVFGDLRARAEVADYLRQLTVFLDETVPLIDADDATLALALGEITGRTEGIRPAARALSLEGVRLYALASDAQRENFVDALLTAVFVSLGLILILGALLVLVERQSRLSLERAVESDQSRKRLAATINASLDAIVVADGSGRIVDWNGAAEEVFGFSRGQAIGAPMAETIIPEKYREAHRRGMARFLATGEKRVVDGGRVELSGLRADGSEFPVELAIGTSEGEGGPILISYLRDISSRRAAELALTEARDAAMAADRAKSEFMAVMSHEMRTPLNGVLGVLDLLDQTDLDERQRRFVSVAAGSGEILLRHINDVLDITRIEAGKMVFAEEPLDLAKLVRDAVEVSRPLAEANGNAINVALDDLAGLTGDPHRIRQVLLNLLGNAAKFTSEGGIAVEARVHGESGDRMEVEFAVSDTGTGIAIEDRDRVFEDFVTLDPSYDRETSGSGLGLAIARRIVRAMGGSIGVGESVLGGARFWFRLPLARSAVEETPKLQHASPEPVRSRRARVLVVEDNEINRMVVREALQNAGHAVVEAVNGAEGVETAADERFDLILMDISMPVMDGLDATRAIRSGGGSSSGTPILGLTAHALPDEQRRFADAGMAECLVKPVRRKVLLGAVTRFVGGESDATEEVDVAERQEVVDEETLSDLASSLTPERFARTVSRVCRELREGVVELEQLCRAGDAHASARVSHKLAGSAAVVGASSVHATLSEIETHAKAGRPAEAAALLPSLAARIEETGRILEEFADG